MLRRTSAFGIMGIVALVALFAMLPVVGAAPHSAEAKTVEMKDIKFNPQTITVNVGDTISWHNGDQTEHTATADNGSFDTDDVEAGETSDAITFNTAGTFAYYCKYHGGPGGSGMSGTVVVQEASQPQPTAAPAQGSAATGALDVSDQPIKDGSITVAKATISQDGWVVVHKAGPDGNLLLTPIIGQTQIKAGETDNVVIKLTEDVAAGAPLWPMLHIDVGQTGVYEFPNGPDVPVASEKATVKITVQPAGAPAQGSAPTATIDVSDQPVKNGTITVPKVTISQDGWVVVHKAGPDGKLLLTPIIGQTQIKAGESTNVVIKLTEDVAVGAPLWPMVHIDVGQTGVYEFPNGPDVPVVANGAPVMKEIKVTAAGGPAQLPRTGGEDAPIGLALSALVLLMAGALLALRMRRRA